MTNRDSLKIAVQEARARLQAAEEALTASYEPTLSHIAPLFMDSFSAEEFRRFASYLPRCGDIRDVLPSPYESCARQVRSGLAELLDRGVDRDAIRRLFVQSRPRRAAEFDHVMAIWPIH